jgi:uncharacterized lipoprotein YddW (UPF0748 family)
MKRLLQQINLGIFVLLLVYSTAAGAQPTLLSVEHNVNGDCKVSWDSGSQMEGYRLMTWLMEEPSAESSLLTILMEEPAMESMNSFMFSSLDKNVPRVFQIVPAEKTPAGLISTLTPSMLYCSWKNGNQPVEWLVVDGFDHYLDRYSEGDRYPPGLVYGSALYAAGVGFNFCSHKALGDKVQLADYENVIWFTGDESPEEVTLSLEEQERITEFLRAGGNLFISGTDIGEDLVQYGTEEEINFMENVLQTAFVEYDAAHHRAVGAGESRVFETVEPFWLDKGQARLYSVDQADVYHPALWSGARPALSLDGVVGHYGTEFEGYLELGPQPCKIIVWGFPFETVFPEKVRHDLLRRIVDFFERPDAEFGAAEFVVKDKNGDAVKDAVIQLEGVRHAGYTDDVGLCLIRNVPPGAYSTTIRKFHQTFDGPRVRIGKKQKVEKSVTIPLTQEIVEDRALWVVRTQMTSPERIQEMVERAKIGNFNQLIVQVRGRGDAYYQSETEPRAEALEGQPEDFDPLQYCIDLAGPAGLEVHAWMNAAFVWGPTNQADPKSEKHILNRHPEWILVNRAGKSLNEYTPGEFEDHFNEGRFLAMHNPEVQEYIEKVWMEVVNKYDIDGIHFDYIRFTTRGFDIFDDYDLGYGQAGRRAFRREYGIDPYDIQPGDWQMIEAWEEFRRDGVATCVRRVYEAVQKSKPAVEVSAAVFNRYHKGRQIAMQDWIKWLEEGYLDTACIMAYYPEVGLMRETVRTGVEFAGGENINAGLGAYRADIETLLEHVRQTRLIGCRGQVFFAYRSLEEEDFPRLAETVYRMKAKSWEE